MGRPRDRWWPGAALILEVRLPTGIERAGFHNNVDVGLTAALEEDVGLHSFHLNVGPCRP